MVGAAGASPPVPGAWGSLVIVTEINPVRALEAVMDGFSVMPAVDAAREGEVFITATGGLHAIGRSHWKRCAAVP